MTDRSGGCNNLMRRCGTGRRNTKRPGTNLFNNCKRRPRNEPVPETCRCAGRLEINLRVCTHPEPPGKR